MNWLRLLLVVVTVLALLAASVASWAILLMIFGQKPVEEPESIGADAFSRSWVGYRALVELLGKKLPVRVVRHDPLAFAAPKQPLLLLEPSNQTDSVLLLFELGETEGPGPPVVVVLPKWQFNPLPDQRSWVENVSRRNPQDPWQVLFFLLTTKVGKGQRLAEHRVFQATTPLTMPARVASSDPRFSGLDGLAIELPAPQALAEPWPGLEPIVYAGPALIVVKVIGSEHYVLTDPDLLNNGGLGRGEHATFTQRLLIDALGAEEIVVDASLTHPAVPRRNVWRRLLDFLRSHRRPVGEQKVR